MPKLVLMALADAADDQGICWPSVATIAVTGGFMKPLQHTCTKDSLMQADAACLIGISLANGMSRTDGRNTTARSAVVMQLQSGLLGRSTGGLRYGLSYPSDVQAVTGMFKNRTFICVRLRLMKTNK